MSAPCRCCSEIVAKLLRGYCPRCYMRWQRRHFAGDGPPPDKPRQMRCASCERLTPRLSFGFCPACLSAWRRHGRPDPSTWHWQPGIWRRAWTPAEDAWVLAQPRIERATAAGALWAATGCKRTAGAIADRRTLLRRQRREVAA